MEYQDDLIFIIEDDSAMIRYFQENIKHSGTELLFANDLVGALSLFYRHKSKIVMIAVDGCLRSRSLNTISLIREIRKNFKGPIVAISSRQTYREQLLMNGCDYECEKNDLPKKITEINISVDL